MKNNLSNTLFLLDFSFIYDQFGKNGKEFISKYLVAHKNITNLKSEIKKIKRERNQFRAQKKLFEGAYINLYEDNLEAEYNSQSLYKILEQFDPYEFDMNLKKNNSNLEFSINQGYS